MSSCEHNGRHNPALRAELVTVTTREPNTIAAARWRHADLTRLSSKSSLVGCSGSRTAHNPSFALGGERQACANIVTRQLREVSEDVVLAHSRCEVRENVSDGDAR